MSPRISEIRVLTTEAAYGSARADHRRADNPPCEECGGVAVADLEPMAATGGPDPAATGATAVGSEWCTNVNCPSNHAVPGLSRVGVNDYTCDACGKNLTTSMGDVIAHRRTH